MISDSRTHYVDFNGLLQLANACTAGALVYVFFAFDSLPPTEYMNTGTAALGLLLALQTQVALWIERRRRDPFVLLLACWMILYYQFRLFTLAMLPYSVVFDRLGYTPGDSNFALVFILLANVCLYAGFNAVRLGKRLQVDAGGFRALAPMGVVILLLVAIAFAYLRGAFWTEDNVPRALNFVSTLLAPDVVILMSLVYLLLFRDSVSRPFALAIAGLIVLDMVAHTLWGSRSAIMGFAQILLVSVLGVLGILRVRTRWVALGALLFPLMLVALVATFTISTVNRIARDGATQLDVGQALTVAGEATEVLEDSPLIDVLLPPIAARAGYFDFSAEIIAHHDEYSPVINLAAYGRSFIDNTLTPGFDIYDQPMTANALRFIYSDQGAPSKVLVSEFYHSDQLCIYGEAYALAGFLSLPLLFLVAIGIKTFFVRLRHPNPFLLGAMRAVTLLVFVRLLDSFGLDWMLTGMLPFLVGLALFAFIFRTRRDALPLPATVHAPEGPHSAS